MKILVAVLLMLSFAFSETTVPKFSADSLVIFAGDFSSPAAFWHQGNIKLPQIYVWFHGGMQSSKCAKGYEAGKALVPFLEKASGESAVVSVSACKENHWLTQQALLAVDYALDSMEARFHIQIDTVSLVGISDGGLGVVGYTLYGKRTVKSRLLISTNLAAVADAQNLPRDPKIREGSWTFMQGGLDRLYPPERILPWLERFCSGLGAKFCKIRFDERGEHDWSWWISFRRAWIQNFFP